MINSLEQLNLDTDTPGGISKPSKPSFQSKTFNAALTFAAKIPLNAIALAIRGKDAENNSQDALRVLDIVLRQQAATRGCLLVRQSFFHDDSRYFTDIGGGVTGVRGFFSLFHEDVSATVILTPGPVIDFLLVNQNIKEARSIDWANAKKILKSMRVKSTHRNMEHKIIGLTEKPCNQL